MKRILQSIILPSIVLLALSCSKDPDVPIADTLDLPKCLTPIQVKHIVEYVSAEISLTVFPDAEKYELVVSAVPLPTNENPYEETWEYHAFFTPDELPFKFSGPDESECQYQIRAVNETMEKEPSEWVTGTFKTDVDPATACGTPKDMKAVALYNKVTISWTPLSNVTEYNVEIYSSSLPDTGNPDPATLVKTLTCIPQDIPIQLEFDNQAPYYYRVRGTNVEAGLKPSKWVKGSFRTSIYEWINDQTAFDYGLTSTKEASVDLELMAAAGIEKNKGVVEPTTVDGVTYGPAVTYFGDRFYINRCKNWDSINYAVNLPLESYMSLRVNKPGEFSFIPRLGATGQQPEVVVGLLTKKNGVQSFKYVYQHIIENGKTSRDETQRLTVPILEDDLFGIDEPATVYLFCNISPLHIYSIKWTPTPLGADATE